MMSARKRTLALSILLASFLSGSGLASQARDNLSGDIKALLSSELLLAEFSRPTTAQGQTLIVNGLRLRLETTTSRLSPRVAGAAFEAKTRQEVRANCETEGGPRSSFVACFRWNNEGRSFENLATYLRTFDLSHLGQLSVLGAYASPEGSTLVHLKSEALPLRNLFPSKLGAVDGILLPGKPALRVDVLDANDHERCLLLAHRLNEKARDEVMTLLSRLRERGYRIESDARAEDSWLAHSERSAWLVHLTRDRKFVLAARLPS